MGKQQQLDDLQAQIIKDAVCPGLAKQATQLVFGTGPADASIVFVGEAPGKNEDQTGKPFVGAAGTFLDEMLASIGLNRDDIYITNIVKYRPPNNRDPLPEEKAAFWPYLQDQLAIISPKVIVTLGRHSGQVFIDDLQISTDHGSARLVNTRYTRLDGSEAAQQFVVLPLYHPAAALYNGSLRATLLEDFKVIKQYITTNS